MDNPPASRSVTSQENFASSNLERLAWIESHPEVSVLIIGGGINGAGLLRELALQGVDALLVEKSDFCSGASAAGSRLIHGGLRYLENREFRLVREALRERNLLLSNAPHYVRPLPVVMPLFDRFSGLWSAAASFVGFAAAQPSQRGTFVVKTGLMLYDWLAGRSSPLPRRRFLSRRQALATYPHLNPCVRATARFYDAQVSHPERLCLELLLDAESLSPKVRAFNYTRVEGLADGCVLLRDELSGRRLAVRPRLVVNAAGPWIDQVNARLNRPTRLIGGTKGSHLVLANPELAAATRGEMFFFTNRDGRICLFYSLDGKVLLGTTDIPVEEPEAECTPEEVVYLLDAVRVVFPSISVSASEIVFRFCGVRPLPFTEGLAPGRISRDHRLPFISPSQTSPFPIFSMVGGKWTTFRAFAEQTATRILTELGRPCRHNSRGLAIGGGKQYPATPMEQKAWLAALSERTGVARDRLSELFERYGTRAAEAANYIAGGVDRPLDSSPRYSLREIEFLCLAEKVQTLEDLILRRTLLGLHGEASLTVISEVAAIAGRVLGWPAGRIEDEITRTAGRLRALHGCAV